jgi:hypothetical protein
MRRLNPTLLALLAGVVILLVALVLFTRRGNENQDKLSDAQLTGASANADARCASPRTYDAIKRELFRQAAETRGSDQPVFDRLAAYASIRVEQPVLKSEDEEVGTVRCSGRLSLDLPPGVAVVGGRSTLSADMDYVLQRAADNSGDVVILEGADPIVVPLATLARTGSNMPPPEVPGTAPPGAPPTGLPPDAMAVPPETAPPPPLRPAPAPVSRPAPPRPPVVREREAPIPPVARERERPRPPVAREPEAPRAPARATARPSFNCRYARTRGEIAVCSDSSLASLDRQMSSQFFRALGSADAGQRERLRVTRTRFLRYRDACRSDACIADAYRGRMAEIRDIMADR